MAAAGEGAGYGAVGGGALGALGGGLSGALKRVASAEKVQASLRQVAETSALKVAGARGTDLRKLVGRRGVAAAEAAGTPTALSDFEISARSLEIISKTLRSWSIL